jgi:hypothetical protein
LQTKIIEGIMKAGNSRRAKIRNNPGRESSPEDKKRVDGKRREEGTIHPLAIYTERDQEC